jgi:mannose-6-phosphate isomerase-like protein (cupin superfamily)
VGEFATTWLPRQPTSTAPDGSAVRVLLGLQRGGLAHFTLPPGCVSRAVRHRTVDEIWYVVAGYGEMWRRLESVEEIVTLSVGCCVSIPVGTAFQFRATGPSPLEAVAVTMPPWPGPGEAAFADSEGPWEPRPSPNVTL